MADGTAAKTDPVSSNLTGAVSELQALLEAAVDGIIIIDEEGTVLEFSAAAGRLFGYSPQEVIGQRVNMLMPEPHSQRHDEYIARYLRTGQARIIGIGREAEARRADGSVFPVALAVGEAIGPGGRRFVGIIRDLTQQKLAEAEARSLQNRLAHVGRFSLMGEMVAGLAHELNQPLGAIVTYAQAGKRLAERGCSEINELLEVCEKIADQAQRAGQVIRKLRDFIRKQEVKKEPLDINDMVNEALNLIEADAHAEGIPISVEYEPDLPRVSGDAIQLQQVLINLTRNAVDAMRGSPRRREGIRIRTQRLDRDGTHVQVTVADHGPGVPPDLLDSIFHPFVSTKPDGLGVGLAISRTIVSAHGGELFCRPNPSGGAVFGFSLPGGED